MDFWSGFSDERHSKASIFDLGVSFLKKLLPLLILATSFYLLSLLSKLLSFLVYLSDIYLSISCIYIFYTFVSTSLKPSVPVVSNLSNFLIGYPTIVDAAFIRSSLNGFLYRPSELDF